jgi:type VI secretion system secreted protein Hcp
MPIDEQLWQPESPFTELEGEELVPQLDSTFGEEEAARLVRAQTFPGSAQPMGGVFVRITGQRQGEIAGDSTARGHEHWHVGTGFDYELTVPLTTGRKQHGPVALTLPWSSASPLIFSAAVNNERLTSVVFEFPATDRDGVEVIRQRITLSDASVTSYRHVAESGNANAAIDRISLVFRQITIEDLLSGKSASDSLGGGGIKSEAEAQSWEAEAYEIDDAGVRRSEVDGM